MTWPYKPALPVLGDPLPSPVRAVIHELVRAGHTIVRVMSYPEPDGAVSYRVVHHGGRSTESSTWLYGVPA